MGLSNSRWKYNSAIFGLTPPLRLLTFGIDEYDDEYDGIFDLFDEKQKISLI